MKNIISVSRRTDVLAFYSDWLFQVLKQQYVWVENPFNHKKFNVSLKPGDVLGFVFWSRYPYGAPKIFDFIDKTYGQNHYINFTINDYPKELESNQPKLEKVIRLVNYLFDRYGGNYVKWRYDPIIISNLTPKDFIFQKFEQLCKLLSTKTRVCITSFVDLYSKVQRRIQKDNRIKLGDLTFEEQVKILESLRTIASGYDIELLLCCESELSKYMEIKTASCVNHFQFDGFEETHLYIAPTRKGCTCYKSIDIGFYNSCLFNCIYCYSNVSEKSSLSNFLKMKKLVE